MIILPYLHLYKTAHAVSTVIIILTQHFLCNPCYYWTCWNIIYNWKL